MSLLQISAKTPVETVVFHTTETSALYLSTSSARVAHVFSLPTEAIGSFWKDQPYTWSGKKGGDPGVRVFLHGEAVPHRVDTRACTPPLVCSLMSSTLKCMPHTEVELTNEDWVNAMRDATGGGSAQLTVYKSSLVRCFSSCCLPASPNSCSGDVMWHTTRLLFQKVEKRLTVRKLLLINGRCVFLMDADDLSCFEQEVRKVPGP